MDLEKEYYDSHGNRCNILQMVKREPEWAANRIQEGERFYHELQELKLKRQAPPEPEGIEIEDGEYRHTENRCRLLVRNGRVIMSTVSPKPSTENAGPEAKKPCRHDYVEINDGIVVCMLCGDKCE